MMTGRDVVSPDVAGGLARHVPVLVRPVVEHLHIRDGGVYIDGTFGAGGYTRAILAAADCRVLALDRDQSAVANAAGLVDAAGGRLTVAESRFSLLDEAADSFGITAVDGVALDLGVSSMQLDTAERGFSFRLDGPLDMRMEAVGPSAADVVAAAAERTLADIIFTLGEERHSRAVARAIVRARGEAPIRTTGQLRRHRRARGALAAGRHPSGDPHVPGAAPVRQRRARRARARPDRGGAHPPARRPPRRGVVPLARGPHREDLPGGSRRRARRLAPPARGRAAPGELHRPGQNVRSGPDEAEIAANPRARSAKLRAGERTSAPPDSADRPALPRLPSLADVMRKG